MLHKNNKIYPKNKKKFAINLREETHGARESTTLKNHVTMLNIKNFNKKKAQDLQIRARKTNLEKTHKERESLSTIQF